MALYGGFSGNGTETAREQRDWAVNKTIIDGNYEGTVVTVDGGPAAVDGFTIENGWSWDGPPSGICCWYSGGGSTTVENNVIRGNLGGGLYSCDPSGYLGPTLSVAGNVFAANGADIDPWLEEGCPVAGGIDHYSSSTTSGQIANNTIICNWGLDGGGSTWSWAARA